MYIALAPALVFLHIFLTCECGPLKKHVPISAITLPMVKQTAKGVASPCRSLEKRRKEPKLSRKPIAMQHRQPVSRCV